MPNDISPESNLNITEDNHQRSQHQYQYYTDITKAREIGRKRVRISINPEVQHVAIKIEGEEALHVYERYKRIIYVEGKDCGELDEGCVDRIFIDTESGVWKFDRRHYEIMISFVGGCSRWIT